MPETQKTTRTLLFAGDSLTDARHREPEFAPLGYGFVSVLHATLALPGWRLVNAGVAGSTIRDLRARWETDITQHYPAVINILIGINDVWRRYSHDDPTSGEAYARTYRELLETPSAQSALVLVCEPFMIPAQAGQYAWLEDLDEKRSAAAQIANEYGATFVPLHDALNRDAVELGIHAVTTDGVHLTPNGHRLLAEHWKRATTELR